MATDLQKELRYTDTKKTQNTGKRKILLLGTENSGKSSIKKVVFQQMLPNETRHLESTSGVDTALIQGSIFVDFEILDFPGRFESPNQDFFDELIDTEHCAIIYVINLQKPIAPSIIYFSTILSKLKITQNTSLHIFAHKADGLTHDSKDSFYHEIISRISSTIKERKIDINENYHITSIYDQTIFAALSSVIHSLMPLQHASLVRLIDGFALKTSVEQCFLVDVKTRLVLAGYSSVQKATDANLCFDSIDMIKDILTVYSGMDSAFVSSDPISSQIRLADDDILCLMSVEKHLGLVCIMNETTYTKLAGFFAPNIAKLGEGIYQIFATYKY